MPPAFLATAASQIRRHAGLLPFLAAANALILTVQHDPFFWDTVQLASKHAHFFYENGLRWALLPTEIDSGHPPALGLYLAGVWTLFGKTLPVSHWAMLPVLLAIVALLYRLGNRLGGPALACWLIPLAWLDPVLAGQSVLVSPDLVLAAFFLLAVAACLAQKPLWLALAVVGLCCISMRGMMTAAALLVWQLLPGGDRRSGRYFLPGLALGAAFLLWHQAAAGWTGFHPASPWAPAFERPGPAGFARNVAVVVWRWTDFGRVAEWLLALGLAWSWRSGRGPGPDRRLLLLLICLALFLTPSALLYRNLSAHRYFLPLFLALHLLIFQWLARRPGRPRLSIALLAALIVVLAAGNRWIYPRGVSMDWDATLAHQPYHALRAEAAAFLDKEGVALERVGSAFPNLATGEQLALDGRERHFVEKDFSSQSYMLVSNVFNDFSEEDFQRLRTWRLWQRWERAGVWMELWRRE